MAMRMSPTMLTPEQWKELRNMAAKENKPSGDIALELITKALDRQILASKSNNKKLDK
ncbi:hypothetical protein SFC19_04150 [Citrobacter portucalensis]|uniref:hypothetical protein n=1 Tax=Citrobacter TaxID=544 RepID=UPI0006590A58|nr:MULTISPECIES: hypothetical protein [Citrobacter]QNM19918.1 hypothetical protein CXM87_07600 [Citrobacter freundii]MDQ9156497.1 hypothetical protein [Citrobacter portucalensis]MEB7911610.1 hypothetical protein [Citrobacter portucalensis]QNM25376.1 hypothetical protein CXM82_08870 [Citrobacter freundii]QNM30070.1 hypothetical protein CXM80_07600 [Citrobacter freundii]